MDPMEWESLLDEWKMKWYGSDEESDLADRGATKGLRLRGRIESADTHVEWFVCVLFERLHPYDPDD
jgi:hypothetical protein